MTAEDTGRRPLALLLDRNFGPFLLGKFISSCGIWIQNLAAAVVAFQLTGSALAVGFVSFLQFLPSLVLTLWTGALADRYDRRLLLMAGRVTSGAAVSSLGALIFWGSLPDERLLTALYVFVSIMGLGLSLSAPSMQAIVPGLVPKVDLESAVTLGAAAPSFARAIGPAVGAAILFSAGPGAAFLVAGGGHLIFGALLRVIRTAPTERSGKKVALLGGIRYALQHRRVAAMILGVALISFGSDPVITLTPSMASALGTGEGSVGVLTTMFGLGAITQALVIRSIRVRLSLAASATLAFGLLVLSLVTLAFAGTLAIASAGFFLSGLAFMIANVSLTTRIHGLVQDEFRGRVLALWSIAFLGARPIVALTNGFVTDWVGLRTGFLTAAVIIVALFPVVRAGFRDTPPVSR